MQKVTTIKELREALSVFNDNDIVVVEIHEGSRSSDLYMIEYIDEITHIEDENGEWISEIRLCI